MKRFNLHLPFGIDLGRAAFSIAFSVVLYVVAVNETNPEATRLSSFTVPVEVVNTPAGMVLADTAPPVRVRIRASQDVLDRVQAASFVAQADASGSHGGQQSDLPVTVRSLDPGVREVTAEPPRVRLSFEDVQERSLPVRANLTGQVPSGYRLGQTRLDPAQVTVGGAASVVASAVEALVDVNVDRVTVTVNGVYSPRVVDARGAPIAGLTIRPAAVNVEIPITQQTQYKEVGIVPAIQGLPALGYVIQPATVDPPSVTVAGDASALDAAVFATTDPVDVTNATSTVIRRVGLQPPSQTLLLQANQVVLVTVRVSPLSTTQSIQVPTSVINLPALYVVAQPTGPVTLTVTGPAPTLVNLTSRDFRVVLDVAGKGIGRFDIAPLVQNLPGGMSIDDLQPKTLRVELAAAPVPTPSPTSIAATLTSSPTPNGP